MFELNDVQKNYVIIGLLIAVLVLVGGTFYFYRDQGCADTGGDKLAEGEITTAAAKTKATDFIKQNLISKDQELSIKSVTSTPLYQLKVKVDDKDITSYMTKDGGMFFPQGYEMSKKEGNGGQSQEIPKQETANLKLFIMSYCPYGLQSQKAYLPVYDLFKDKADMEIYFVDYAMHDKKELDENMRQYCIQKNQTDKFDDYLSCFVKSSNSDQCLSQAGVDQDSLSSCVASVDEEYGVTEKYNDKSTWRSGQFPQFPVQSDLNEKYGVKGSPALVINGQEVEFRQRAPENLKQKLCSGFKEKPEECSQTLSTTTPSRGFGGGSTSNSGGSCE